MPSTPTSIIENVLYGLATRNYGPMPTGLFAYNPEIEQFGYHYDPEQANALLDEAGWIDSDGDGVREKDGTPLELLFWTWNDSAGRTRRSSQVLQNQLAQVGIKITIETLDVATLIAPSCRSNCRTSTCQGGAGPSRTCSR